jgi:hypothetical protein
MKLLAFFKSQLFVAKIQANCEYLELKHITNCKTFNNLSHENDKKTTRNKVVQIIAL